MKKVALIVALFMVFAVISGEAALQDDKEFRAGLKNYNSKNYKEAVKHFKEYTAKKPDPAAYYLIGYSLYKLGKFSEADDYFKEAFFVDPDFSLEKAGLIRNVQHDTIVRGPVAPPQRSPEPESKASGPALTVTPPATPEQTAPVEQMQKGQEPAVPPSATPIPSAPGQQLSPLPQTPQPTPAFPPMPAPKKQMPKAVGPAALVGVIAALGMFFFVIAIAFYVYYCLCMFLIAKKLDVPAPWTAWIPIVQVWTFVASAGKPAWWIILLIVPIVNFFVIAYLWMCIAENLGKNKWLGLLMLLPIVNMIFLGILAFSKSESIGYSAGETLPE